MNTMTESKCMVELVMEGKTPKNIADLMQCDESVVIQHIRTLPSKKKDEYIRKCYLRGETYQVIADVIGISKPGVFVRIKRNLTFTATDEAIRRYNKDPKLGIIKPKRYCKNHNNCGNEITNYNKNAIYCHTCSNKCKQNDYYHKNKERYMEMQRRYQSRKK